MFWPLIIETYWALRPPIFHFLEGQPDQIVGGVTSPRIANDNSINRIVNEILEHDSYLPHTHYSTVIYS